MRVLFFLLFIFGNLHAQQKKIDAKQFYLVGAPFPDIDLTNIQFSTFITKKVSDFKGKWLLLDFFTTGCTGCFKLMPEINAFQQKYKNKFQVIMIGLNEHNLPALYEKHRVHKKLELPVTFVNRNYWNQFDICGLPQAALIDPEGNLRSVSAGIHAKDLEKYLSGNDPQLLQKKSCTELKLIDEVYDWSKPLFMNGNGGKDTLVKYRSQLTGYSGNRGPIPDYMMNMQQYSPDSSLNNMAWFDATARSLAQLYQLAYADTLPNYPASRNRRNVYGKMWNRPILEVKDSAVFLASYLSAQNQYNYSLIVPKEKGNAAFMQKLMQSDLKNYFGYDVVVEDRLMPCWLLTADKDVKKQMKINWEKNKGKELIDKTSLRSHGVNMEELLSENHLYNTYLQTEPPVFDQTGIDYHFNIHINALWDDRESLIKGLRENGLNLIKSERMMKVVVLKDPG